MNFGVDQSDQEVLRSRLLHLRARVGSQLWLRPRARDVQQQPLPRRTRSSHTGRAEDHPGLQVGRPQHQGELLLQPLRPLPAHQHAHWPRASLQQRRRPEGQQVQHGGHGGRVRGVPGLRQDRK